MASKLHSVPLWPNSTFATSNGIAPSRCATDRAGRSSGGAVNKGFKLRIVAMTFKPGCRNDRKYIHRQENTNRRHNGSRQAGNEKTDESDGYDNWTRGNHRDGHGVQKLMLVEPSELLHHSLVQERNNREAAAEHKSASFGKKQ